MIEPFELPLSREAFRDALSKGLGRAHLQVREHGIGGLEDELLEACRTDLSFDAQVDGSRGEWLWELVTHAALEDRVRSIAFEALRGGQADTDYWSFLQNAEIVGKLIQTGDQEAKELYYSALCRSYTGEASEVEGELRELTLINGQLELAPLLEVDGIDALLEVARRLEDAARDMGGYLVAEACEIWGESAVLRQLKEAALQELGIRRFLEAAELDSPISIQPSFRPTARPDGRTAEELVAALEASARSTDLEPRPRPFRAWAWAWAQNAPESERRRLAELLFDIQSPEAQADALKAFQRSGLPELDSRLLSFARSEVSALRLRAKRVLRNHEHPAVRALALEDFLAGRAEGVTIDMLANNWQAGDERLLIELARSVWDADPGTVHDITYSLTDLLSDHPEVAAGRDLALFVYERGPCGSCRSRAFSILDDNGWMPGWVAREAIFDAQEDIRALLAE